MIFLIIEESGWGFECNFIAIWVLGLFSDGFKCGLFGCQFSGFMGAMISNLAFVFRNIFSKRGMKGKSVSGMNYYACLSLLSLLLLTPFAIAVEGPQMWAVGWENAISQIGPHFIW